VSRDPEQALASAYAYLGSRERTVAEMRSQLRNRTDCDCELVESVIAELTEKRYLDDERYARCFAEDRRNLDSWGSERIYRRLLELGIERETAELAAKPDDPERELEAALALLHRRVRLIAEDPRARQRALGLLMRRGYSQSVSYEAIKRLEQEPTCSP
jgi:regulatory protein